MSSDIDIEEHNVLDHPKIKTIFPDISSIKTEIVDIDDEEMLEYADDNEYLQEDMYHDDMLEDDTHGIDGIDDIHLIDPASFHHVSQNKIILGTKPVPERDPTSAHVSLIDWKYILNRHKFYCQECMILFPTQNTMDAHRMTAHSLLVAVQEYENVDEDTADPPRVNKAKKSTTKSVAALHCSGFRHNKAVKSTAKVKTDVLSASVESASSVDRSIVSIVQSASNVRGMVNLKKCPVCKCYYLSERNIRCHFMKNHGTSGLRPIDEPFSGKCSFCDYKTINFKKYNFHLQQVHNGIFKRLCAQREQFACSEHDLTFTSANALHIHRVAAHTPDDSASAVHVGVVPREILFKCDKCPNHFLASCAAFSHSVQCVKTHVEWTCAVCKRAFRSSDIQKHKLQHALFKKFNVLKISQKLTKRVACKCPQCGVLFDERTFWKCHAPHCVETASEPCAACGSNVERSFVDKHSRIHAANLKILTIEFVTGQLELKAQVTPVKPGANNEYRSVSILYYCRACKTYCHTKTQFHLTEACCDMSGVKKRTCKLCGLCFTTKTFPTHMAREHDDRNFNLGNIDFFDIKTEQRITPPLPEWKKCSQCKINFFGQRALRKHNCFEEKFKNCAKCDEGFSDLAYKLHAPFHAVHAQQKRDVEMPDLMKKYESMQSLWNIIYLCQVCGIVFDNYDKVIEHCQDHFCNMESFDVQIEKCHICNLQFDQASYRKHADIHLNPIKKSSFQILKFNYENLLNDAWFDVFKPITEEQRGHILARSAYNIDRCIRFKLEMDGFSNNTMFKCNICNNIIDKDGVLEHARNQDACARSKQRFTCMFCNLSFQNKNTKVAHERDHIGNTLKENSIRLVTFNHQNDFATNFVMCNLPRKDSLKFNWCQECNLLIKKQDYNKHLMKHKPKKVTYAVKKASKPMKMYDVYQCVHCNGTVFKFINVKRHNCPTNASYQSCKYCNLRFRKCFMAKHYAFHKIKPSFNKNTINVIPFDNGNVEMVSQIVETSPVLPRSNSILLTLYQCQKCRACVSTKSKMKSHTCVTNKKFLVPCSICRVYFRRMRFKYHENIHKLRPDITKSNIEIVKYNLPADKTVKRKLEEIVTPRKKIKVEMPPDANKTISPDPMALIYRRISVVYKCACNILFENRINLAEHMKVCRSDRNAVACNLCGLQFHQKDIQIHENTDACADSKFYLVGSVVINNKHTHDPNHWITNCSECNLYYMNVKGLKIHMAKGHLKRSISVCPQCNVLFPQKRYKEHVVKHHEKMKVRVSELNRESFDVVSIAELVKLNAKIGCPSEALSTNVKEQVVETSILYKCSDCELYFTLRKTLGYHYEKNQHDIKRFPCKYCGLNFTQILLRRHEEFEHTINDFKIVISPDVKERTFKRESLDTSSNYSFENTPVKIERIPSPLKIPKEKPMSVKVEGKFDVSTLKHRNNTAEEARIIRKLSKTPIQKLKMIYQCDICKLSFLHEDTIACHMSKGTHTSRCMPCSECGLLFTKPSLQRHTLMHHEILKFKLEDFQRRIYTSETYFYDAPIDNAIPTSSEANTAKIAIEQEIAPVIKTEAPMLYKCAHCDVYFTSHDMCWEHTNSHTPLDSTEYIGCKICDLQLLCECLGVHMRGHRENTFDIDNLVVTEYQPREHDTPLTSTYLAAEKLKSKLISTTTDCGNED
ncbi:zinc finger protein 91-like [Zerene cesonia]|uniref:zinc finger protein 91-like n=1 Tax=Zerene cesonia TaxID=33412 RepID=UPI0018E546C4|nr:zinc finger protein 91-like [Zerene cesonia]